MQHALHSRVAEDLAAKIVDLGKAEAAISSCCKIDCHLKVCLEMLTNLLYRRPDVSVIPSEDGLSSTVKVHSMDEKEAVQLTLHQIPISVTFAFFQVLLLYPVGLQFIHCNLILHFSPTYSDSCICSAGNTIQAEG